MASQFNGTMRRTLYIDGVDQPITLVLDKFGIEAAVSGQKLKLRLSWKDALAAAHTPLNVPSFLEGKPLELLKYQAAKRRSKNAKGEGREPSAK